MKPHQISMLAPPVTKHDAPTSDDRCTPPNVLACVSSFWSSRRDRTNVDLDPASNPWSLVRARVAWNKRDDALALDWLPFVPDGGRVWLNPPFSNPEPFADRLARVVKHRHAEGLLLCRHDSTTAWWELIERDAVALCLVRARVHFRLAGEDTGAADHATTIALFSNPLAPHSPKGALRNRMTAFARAFDPLGMIVEVKR